MTRSSLPAAIATTHEPQAFAARAFARGSWQRDCLATRGSIFGLPGKSKPATGHRPYQPSNTPIA